MPRLRVAEPVGRHVTLGAALRTIAGIADRLGCHEAQLEAEPGSSVWAEMVTALRQIGPAHGFVPRGADWVRVLADAIEPP